jgi:hypothetical protein
MGLLDDAIREHLELKRLRGADPGDVAREEDAALGPVRRQDELDTPSEGHTEAVPQESFSRAAEVSPQSDPSAGQETVEINMEAELAGSDPNRTPSNNIASTAQVSHPRGQASSDESLEWEMPGERPVSPDAALGERSDDADGSKSKLEQDELLPVEDVLEETPDFLQDTPEQERLWFEQRPPRDFDFDD